MITILHEQILYDYWLFEAAIGDIAYSHRDLFFDIAEIYGTDGREAEDLYRTLINGELFDVRTKEDFKRHQRIAEYLKLTGEYSSRNADNDKILLLKGRAYSDANQFGLVGEERESVLLTREKLCKQAETGNVYAKRLVGFLLANGILFKKNVASGMRYLSEAADWNDVFSVMALVNYDAADRRYNISRLLTLSKSLPDSELFDNIFAKYDFDADECEHIRLLDELFATGICKKEQYLPAYAKVLSARTISASDKSMLVKSMNADSMAIVAQLPFCLKKVSVRNIEKALTNAAFSVKRQGEIAGIVSAIEKSECLGGGQSVCVWSDSPFVRGQYASAFSKTAGARCTVVKVSELSYEEIERTCGNFFIKGLRDGSANIVVFEFCGAIDNTVRAKAIEYLSAANLKRYKIKNLSLTLDLSNVMTVCVSDTSNAKFLGGCCEVIGVARLDCDEFTQAVTQILMRKSKKAGVNVSFACDMADIYAKYSVADLDSALDEVCWIAKNDRSDKAVTADTIGEILSRRKKMMPVINQFGFGGKNHEFQ